MCGILAVLGCSDDSQTKRARVLELSRRLKHRGPDWSGLYQRDGCFIAHQRLAIVDPASGDQPLYNEDKTIVVAVNGEIYNHEDLRSHLPRHKFKTGSDCEVIAHLYEEYGENFVNMLDGMFSFVLLDTHDNSFISARDAIGITPLYIGWALDGSVWVSSELKGLNDECEHFEVFPPGHLFSSKTGGFKRWYNPPWFNETIPSAPYDPIALRHALESAVIKRLMTDVPFGVLLSGGLDSSLVASIAARHLSGTKAAKLWGAQLHSFSVGLEGSPDLKAAAEVADCLGTVHHEFHFSVQDGIDAIEDVIYHIETYDVTTVRASTPMFLMARKIKSLGVKMVISGEGADEIFGGYLYFHKAPNKEEFHRETCRKIKAIHLYDCLRANKSTSAWGVEARVPFLDKEFINVVMSIDPEMKMIDTEKNRIEKWILRKAFDDEDHPYLPKHILYRQKEQFSDGVGYSWIDGLKDHAELHVTDKMMLNASHIYPHNTPQTKEAYYYRMTFEQFFPQNSAILTVPGGASVACSTAKAIEWDAAWSNHLDPSGRAALGVHDSAYEVNHRPEVSAT
ncbi:putative asparagine synthase (glutamine-hydrolyzing) [Helianthus annuus]|uniref:Asparagine synthetase [glutamine-hydrolyzing] n=1 Tax=Helianthus annuus TaxID=4232 RepID=A0A251UMS5_HELAN|nr:putative asparagine synthase (glutamine-hydrolyzing) [Helianthus annuus]KAJ0583530.1 putative asparagine synthase (glutamine-hydrolyzing) [Helianthus annuus]KAJ0638632.1 putative asparagine synthase (glutamine-hydrolyzing) [Helianthus annuus]KAJ0749266.1 putative asparagine synthase (glutamine-hydrolyzing) [Helianthus annuus]